MIYFVSNVFFFVRTLVCSVKSTEMPDELLIALGLRDKQWSVLDQVTVRNLQNGLVSFELTESFDRFVTVKSFGIIARADLNGGREYGYLFRFR